MYLIKINNIIQKLKNSKSLRESYVVARATEKLGKKSKEQNMDNDKYNLGKINIKRIGK